MRPPREPVFLERQTYRRRRLMDAARLLPLLGAVLFAFPLVWGEDGGSTAVRGLYVFGVWFFLILSAGLMARRLADSDAPPPPEGGDAPE
ncbi:hypothetical protein [Tranquillimonas alkanivorans]|uniref:Uncharacterized protein n=1 Tax=Tranquillimonas alkanivorans TaxID=441119 RepID=A0A1I5SM64_9RHOB|nr:hypothetical protein [Tranquillimonas alkanivorans]SFP71843.1 hypothetical protein SAMN04488047_11191 [Tranquillimonas alkanivorans]